MIRVSPNPMLHLSADFIYINSSIICRVGEILLRLALHSETFHVTLVGGNQMKLNSN